MKKSILNPPKSYVEFRIATHEKTSTQLEQARLDFYGKHKDCKREIIEFINWLEEERQNRTLPVERILVPGTGKSIRMMIYDIEYWYEKGKLRQRKVYLPLERFPEIPKELWGVDLRRLALQGREPVEQG